MPIFLPGNGLTYFPIKPTQNAGVPADFVSTPGGGTLTDQVFATWKSNKALFIGKIPKIICFTVSMNYEVIPAGTFSIAVQAVQWTDPLINNLTSYNIQDIFGQTSYSPSSGALPAASNKTFFIPLKCAPMYCMSANGAGRPLILDSYGIGILCGSELAPSGTQTLNMWLNGFWA